MFDTRHCKLDNLIPPLCRALLEDLMHTVLFLHGVSLQAPMTRTAPSFCLMQLGFDLLHLSQDILDIGILLTKSTLQVMQFCLSLTN